MSGDSLCGEHPEEKLRFVCVPCDTPICRDCKLTEHDGHRSIDIAKVAVGLKDKLVNHRSRLEHRLRVLEVVTAEVEEDQTKTSQAQLELEKRIKDRVALVTSWLRQAEHAALSALKATAMKVDENLSSTSSDLHKRREEIRKMIAPISQMTAAFDEPNKLDRVAALLLERDMRTGRGKGENLEKLTEGLPTYSVKPTLRSDSGGLTEEMVRRFIGTPLYTQLTKSAPKVALSPLFRCCSASGACVNAICPMADGKVWVAHDVASGTSREQRVALYSVEGTALREQKVAGRVSIARAYGDWVYVAGPSVKKMMDGQETRDAVSERSEGSRKEKSTQPKQSVAALSKLDIRFSIKASTSGSGSGSGSGSVSGTGSSQEVPASESVICTLEARALPLLWIVSQPSFSVSAELPQALDVDSTGQFFAVVVLKPAVELYRSCHPDPVAVYSPIGENFSPSDVCFHVLDGTEVLLVADWFNSAVHVLSFHDGLRFQGYLGAGCPLMKQPTALTCDDDNRLWIGCKGGQLLMCVSVEDSSDEGEWEEEEEQREEKAEGDGDREKIALVNHRSRLEHRLRVLEVVTAEVEEDQTKTSQAQLELEKRIKDRVALVTSWLRQAEHAALSALKATAMKVDENLSSTSSDLHKRREEIRKMIAPISQMTAAFDEPNKLDRVAALLLERDMRTGRGKGENLEKLTEGLPTYSVKPTLRSDSGGLTEEMVRRFIGTPLYTQLTKSAPKVALSPLFRCCSASGACVNAICPMADGKVWVAHDVASGTSREQRVALYSVEGTALREQKVAGRVSIARAYGDWVYVAGPSVKKMMDGQETRDAVSERSEGSRKEKSTQPKQSVAALSKLDIRFSIKASTSGSGSGSGSGSVSGTGSSQEVPASESVICTLEARALPLLWIVSQPSFSVSAELPQALDVDSTGQFFAVVVLKPAVELYRSCHPDPVAVYSPIGENFSPSDVCFHVLDGTEVLLVADWFNSAVHVLSFHDGLRFQGYLGAGCPLMKQPTALTCDDDNRLWIGCKGGQLLMCVSVEDSSDEGEWEEEEEQREEKAEGDGDREKIAV